MTRLLDKQLVFVTGKGGVGKTVMSAALARVAASRGRRTLICEIDTDPAMGRLFGGERVGFTPTRVADQLYACNLSAAESLEAFVRRFVPSRRVADLILANKVASTFFHAAPSVIEAVILDQLAVLLTESEPRFDTVVVDLPASGHAVTLLKVPKSMARMVAVGELADHLRRLAATISDPHRTEVVVVTLPDEMAVNETIELWHNLRHNVDTPAHTVIVNGTRAVSLRDEDLTRLEALLATDPALESAVAATKLGLYWQREDQTNVDRLSNAVDARVVVHPFHFHKTDERALVSDIAATLSAALAG